MFKEKLKTVFDFIFNDDVLAIGEFLVNFFTITASLYFAITGKLPVIPQWAWAGVFGFALITGTYSLENVINYELEPEDEEEEEIVEKTC